MPSLSPLSSLVFSQYKDFHSISFHVIKAVVTLYFLTSVRREERLHGGEHFYELLYNMQSNLSLPTTL